MKTLICLILDRSGSMGGKEDDVVGGVNAFIEDQKKIDVPTDICMVRFDDSAIERFRPLQPLNTIIPLGRGEYQPRGGTPLLDAVGGTLEVLQKEFESGGYSQGILVVVTDGAENSSVKFTKAMVKEMVVKAQESGKWAVIYLGADVDAFAEAGQMGIHLANTARVSNANRDTIFAGYKFASASVGSMRATGATITHNLGTDYSNLPAEAQVALANSQWEGVLKAANEKKTQTPDKK